MMTVDDLKSLLKDASHKDAQVMILLPAVDADDDEYLEIDLDQCRIDDDGSIIIATALEDDECFFDEDTGDDPIPAQVARGLACDIVPEVQTGVVDNLLFEEAV